MAARLRSGSVSYARAPREKQKRLYGWSQAATATWTDVQEQQKVQEGGWSEKEGGGARKDTDDDDDHDVDGDDDASLTH